MRYFAVILLAMLLLFSAQPAMGVELVAPGETLHFIGSDGGMRICREKDFLPNSICLIPPVGNWGLSLVAPLPGGLWPYQGTFPLDSIYLYTVAEPGKNQASAAFSVTGFTIAQIKIGIPHVATAAVYSDFEIDDPEATGHLVDAQIAIAYAWEALLQAGGNYDVDLTVTLEVEDVTEAASPIALGSFELVNRNRQGDQGIEIALNLGTSGWDQNSESAAVTLQLRRGRSYRIWFKAETAAAPNALTLSVIDAGIRARWTALTVTVAEDLVAMLEELKTLVEECNDGEDDEQSDDEQTDEEQTDEEEYDLRNRWRDRIEERRSE